MLPLGAGAGAEGAGAATEVSGHGGCGGGLAALGAGDAGLEVALPGGQPLQRLAAIGPGGVELLLLRLEGGALVGELLVADREIVAGGGDPVLGVGEAGDGGLDLVAQVLDAGDRVLLVLVDAVEVGGIDRGVLPARGLDQQLDHVRVVGLVDADEDLRELLDGDAEVVADASEMLAALGELVLGGGELLLLGLEIGGGGLLGLPGLGDLADQRVDLLVALVELLARSRSAGRGRRRGRPASRRSSRRPAPGAGSSTAIAQTATSSSAAAARQSAAGGRSPCPVVEEVRSHRCRPRGSKPHSGRGRLDAGPPFASAR